MRKDKNSYTVIDKDILDEEGFKETLHKVFMEQIDEKPNVFTEYSKSIKNKFYLVLNQYMSNSENRKWNLHIDNERHETIASVDIQTVSHFNAMMDLMDIPYKLRNLNETDLNRKLEKR